MTCLPDASSEINRVLLTCAAAPDALWAVTNSRPNIVLLTGEDTGLHLGCYGERYADTPNLDRLAGEGCRYEHAYSHGPVCAPSRSGLVTGRYPWRLGTHNMRSTLTRPPRLFTHELRDAGYRVLWPTKTDFNFEPDPGFADSSEEWLTLESLPVGQQPFFAYWNFSITHESRVWDSVNGKPQDFGALVDELPRERRHDPDLAPVPPYLPDTPPVRKEIARYFDTLAVQDLQVGRALELLERLGIAERTIVIYCSDHGRGLCREKRWCYDAGLHLPLLIRAPGEVGPGSVGSEMIGWVDLAPTILSLAGVRAPESYQGRAFLGPERSNEPRRFVVSGRDRMDEQFDRVRSCRTRRFRYIRNDFPQVPYMHRIRFMENGLTTRELREARAQGALTPAQSPFMADTKPTEELYDTVEDPHNVRNLAGEPAFRDTLRSLRGELETFLEASGDLGRIPEPQLVADGLITNRLEDEYRPRVAPLPERYRIGKGENVLTSQEAVERYGPSPRPD